MIKLVIVLTVGVGSGLGREYVLMYTGDMTR